MGARILNFFWKPIKWSNLIYQICLGLVSIKTNKTGNFRHLLTGVELSQKLEITRKVCKPSNLKISKTSVQEETFYFLELSKLSWYVLQIIKSFFQIMQYSYERWQIYQLYKLVSFLTFKLKEIKTKVTTLA